MILAHQEFTEKQQKEHALSHKIVVIVDVVVNGKKVICPIEIDAEVQIDNNVYDSNHIATYFDRKNIDDLIKEAVARENIGEVGFYYINNKKAHNLLQDSGYQLPQHLAGQLSASMDIIRHIDANVNRKIKNFLGSKQFIRWFGDWINHPEWASKIVDDNGIPMVVYHGTNADFTEFDLSKSSDTTKRYIDGFYFTTEEKVAKKIANLVAKSRGGDANVLAVYLDVKNPLVLTAEEYQKIGFNEKWRNEVLNKLTKGKHDGVIIKPERERVAGVFADSYNYDADANVYANADKYGITDKDYAWWLNRAVSNPDFTATQIAVFKPEQVKSATDNIGTYDKGNTDILHQKRISTPDPSTILKDVIRNKVGAKEYGKYTESLKKYQDLDVRVRNQEKRIAEIDKEIKALKHNKAQSGKGARMDELYRQRKTAENKAEEYRNRMFALESKELSGIVRAETEKARITAQREASEKYKQKSKERTENAEKRQYIEKIEKRAIKLSEMLKSNSKDKHIPEIFQQGVGEFLEALDFSSKRYLNGGAKTNKEINLETKMKNLVEILEGRAPGNDINEFLEAAGLNDDDAKVMVTETLRKAYGEVYSLSKVYGDQDGVIVLQNLSAEQLRNINSALRTLNHLINQVNEVVSNSRYDSIMALGKATVDDCQAFKTYTKQKFPAQVDKFFKWTNALPYYAFRRMGKAASSVFESFMDGFDVYTDKITQVLAFTDKALDEKDVKKWSKEIHEFETDSGDKLYMSTADIMSFYCLEKREQGNKHISGGGIVVPVRKGHLVGQTKVQTFANKPKGVVVTDDLRTRILMELTSEQVEVAKSLQEYMSTVCAEWGNEISMKRFGVRQFTEKNYFPVRSSENVLPKNDQVGSKERGIFHLLNASFTQNTIEGANNRIDVDNIFDVFAAHCIEMAKYNAFALQLIDIRKWLNYKTKTEINGQQSKTEALRDMLDNAFGKDAEKYIDTFLLDINGADKSGDRGLELLRSIVGNTKIAAVGLNLNVMLIQPTAYFRASAVINPKYLITEIKDTFQLRKAIERGEKYSGIFRWKSLGYRGFNLAAPISDKIKHTESFQSKFSENVSMKGAELMDKLTWGALWLACENETADLNKNLTKGSDEFYKAVAKRFREIIYTTQVVDSPLTKTEFMRSKGFANSIFGSFMSEPSTSYNLFLDVANDISDTKRKGQKIEKRHIAKLARVGVAFAVTELVTAVLRSFLDAAHDIDDEDDEYWELYLQNFAENYLEGLLMPKVPIINDILSAIIAAFAGGYSSSSLEMTSFERIAKFARNIWRLVNGKSVDWTKLFKSFFDAFSSASGLPISNVWREIVTIFNIIENASN